MIRNNLKKILDERKITISVLHKESGISYKRLHKIANNSEENITTFTLNTLCTHLKCEISELLEFVLDDNIYLRTLEQVTWNTCNITRFKSVMENNKLRVKDIKPYNIREYGPINLNIVLYDHDNKINIDTTIRLFFDSEIKDEWTAEVVSLDFSFSEKDETSNSQIINYLQSLTNLFDQLETYCLEVGIKHIRVGFGYSFDSNYPIETNNALKKMGYSSGGYSEIWNKTL